MLGLFITYFMSCDCGIILSVPDMCMGDGTVFILMVFLVFLPSVLKLCVLHLVGGLEHCSFSIYWE